MSNEYPKMLFRPGHQITWDGKRFDILVVDSDDQEKAAKASGWMHAADARKADQPAIQEPAKVVDEQTDDNAPPTRNELERKAKELGIKFDGRWGDKRLSDAIAKKLKG